jgi:hypothetical protein
LLHSHLLLHHHESLLLLHRSQSRHLVLHLLLEVTHIHLRHQHRWVYIRLESWRIGRGAISRSQTWTWV